MNNTQSSQAEENGKRSGPISWATMFAVIVGLILSFAEVAYSLDKDPDSVWLLLAYKGLLLFLLATSAGIAVDYLRGIYSTIAELDKHIAAIRALEQDIADHGAIIVRTAPRPGEDPSYIISSEPYNQHLTVQESPFEKKPKWACVYSLLSRTHGKNLQNLLLSAQYLRYMVHLSSVTNRQVRVLILPDRLRHGFVLEAFFGLSDALETLETRWARKAEFFDLLSRFDSSKNGSATTAWKGLKLDEVRALSQMSAISKRHRVLTRTKEFLRADANFYIGADSSSDDESCFRLPGAGIKWRIQYYDGGSLQLVKIDEWDAEDVTHCAALIVLAYLHLAYLSDRTRECIGYLSAQDGEGQKVLPIWPESAAATAVDFMNSLDGN